MEDLIGTVRPFEAQADVAVLAERDLVGDRALQPVDAEGRCVQAKVIARVEEVVPISVDADARAEAEIEEEGRKDARLLVWSEQEEVLDDARPLLLLAGRDEPPDGAAD